MTRTLPDARGALVTAIEHDTAGMDRRQHVAVLDALIAWATARPQDLVFRSSDGVGPVISFEHKKRNVVFWAIRLTRGVGARLEIYPPTGRALADAQRLMVRETINAHTRDVLAEGDRLRISFGALKNANARAAVLDMLNLLLAEPAPVS